MDWASVDDVVADVIDVSIEAVAVGLTAEKSSGIQTKN